MQPPTGTQQDKPLSPDWLKAVADGTLEITGENLIKALRNQGLVQVLGKDGTVLTKVKLTSDCHGFRLTRRGRDFLNSSTATNKSELPFNKDDLPLNIKLWISAFRRWCRNCPPGLSLAYSDEKLRVLAKDMAGSVKDDEAHQLSEMKVPWVEGS